MVTTQTPETEKVTEEASEDELESIFSKCRNSDQKGLGEKNILPLTHFLWK